MQVRASEGANKPNKQLQVGKEAHWKSQQTRASKQVSTRAREQACKSELVGEHMSKQASQPLCNKHVTHLSLQLFVLQLGGTDKLDDDHCQIIVNECENVNFVKMDADRRD